MEERIIELETRLSFLEAAQDELSDALAKQQQTLLQLNKKLSRLLEHIEQAGEQEQGGITYPSANLADEVPPHY